MSNVSDLMAASRLLVNHWDEPAQSARLAVSLLEHNSDLARQLSSDDMGLLYARLHGYLLDVDCKAPTVERWFNGVRLSIPPHLKALAGR